MAISYIYSGEPMTGTANDDFFIAYKGSTGTDNNTINGNNGDDLVIGDSSDTWVPSSSYQNGSIGTAFNLESITSPWTTAENAMFGDWTIPHTTAIVEATIGQSEFFRVAIGAGQQITIDIDFASNTAIGISRDLVVELQDSLGNVIASADDSLVTQGGRGSFPSVGGSASSYDPYLTFTVPTAGIYYINVRPFGGGPGSTFTDNATFLMNVSVTNHATAASNPVQGADVIDGGAGDDALFGAGGADTINGGIGNDYIDGGSGGDIIHGGDGNDFIYSGDGTEENAHGDDGDDILYSGGEGHYYGDAGNDRIHAGLTAVVNEILDGGTGIDTIDTTTWNGSYTVNLATGVTNFGESFINFENVFSGNGADTITGTDGDNVITTQGGIDTVTAGAGDDTVSGGADGDTLDGGAGSDILDYRNSSGAVTINLATNTASGGHAAGDIISNFEGVRGSVLGDQLTGSGASDKLYGFEGNDTLTGGNGSDILDGGINDDVMTGGLGNDTYYVDSLGDTVNELPGEGTDTMALGFSYVLADGSVIEHLATIDPLATAAINLTGNSSANTLTGNDGNNVLNGGDGADALTGGAGGDVLIGGLGADQLSGGGDADYLQIDDADTGINGGSGFDSAFVQTSAAVTLNMGTVSIEWVQGNAGADSFNAASQTGAVYIYGQGGNDTITGSAFGDYLDGGDGTDTLAGGGGADLMLGNGGSDILLGEGGDDSLIELGGDSQINGGTGFDSLFVWSDTGVALNLATASIEWVQGSVLGNDNLNGSGNTVNTFLYGWGGNDKLRGGAGDDYIAGGAGDDTLTGGAGNDTLIGEAGVDRYVYTSSSWGSDTIHSFDPNGEKLDFTGYAGIDSFSDFTTSEWDPGGLGYNSTTLFYTAGGTTSSITLIGVQTASLSNADFLFA